MLTISAEIKKDGKRLDGTYNVKLRFTLGRKVKRKSTSLFATSKDLKSFYSTCSNFVATLSLSNFIKENATLDVNYKATLAQL